MRSYFRDVLDHVLRINQQVSSMHELLSNLFRRT